MVEFMDTNCGYCQKVAQDEFPTTEPMVGLDATRLTPANVSVEFVAVSIMLWDENTQGKEYGRSVIEQFRSDYGHNFLTWMYKTPFINPIGVDWEHLLTLVAPNGIIEYATPEADQGYSIWDAMEDKSQEVVEMVAGLECFDTTLDATLDCTGTWNIRTNTSWDLIMLPALKSKYPVLDTKFGRTIAGLLLIMFSGFTVSAPHFGCTTKHKRWGGGSFCSWWWSV